MKKAVQRFFNHRWLICLLIIVFSLALLFLVGSLIMQWQKRETCENIVDVWEDIGHLMFQTYDSNMDFVHNLNSVKVYFRSNLLDGILYEWRWLEKHELLPVTPTTKYISLENEEQDVATPQNGESYSVPMLLMIRTEETVFHDNPNTLDYTKTISTVDIDGKAIYSVKDGSLLWEGYTSEIKLSDYVIDSQNGTEREQESLKGEFFEAINDTYSIISSDLTMGVGCGDTLFLDFGVLQYQYQ